MRPALWGIVAAPVILPVALIANAASAADKPVLPKGGFVLPLQCTLQQDCWILNYVDTDPGPGARDGHCGNRTYDGHKGTDFALRDMAAMKRGVTVRAALAGTVLRIRNNAPDKDHPAQRNAVTGRDCGNGIVLGHPDGWETQYCHLRKGSITVRPGDSLRRGQSMGLVGLSGRTDFPHVHLSIRHAGRVFDPVTNRLANRPCGPDKSSATGPGTLIYRPSELYAAGFSARPPTAHGVKRDASGRRKLSPDAPALILRSALFGGRAGQKLSFEIRGPGGAILLRRETVIRRSQAWRLAYAGKKRRPGARWPPGRYHGTVTLSRKVPPASRDRAGADFPVNYSRQTSVTIR